MAGALVSRGESAEGDGTTGAAAGACVGDPLAATGRDGEAESEEGDSFADVVPPPPAFFGDNEGFNERPANKSDDMVVDATCFPGSVPSVRRIKCDIRYAMIA